MEVVTKVVCNSLLKNNYETGQNCQNHIWLWTKSKQYIEIHLFIKKKKTSKFQV